jgi:hypothetical protein
MKDNNRVDDFTDNAIFATVNSDGRTARSQMALGIDRESIASDKAQIKADELSLIRSRLAASSAGHLTRAADLIIKSPSDRLSDADYKQFRERVNYATAQARTDNDLADLEKRFRKQVVQVRDVDPYAKGSPHSYIQDYLAVSELTAGTAPDRRFEPGHEERLARHSRIVAREVDERSDYGQWVERAFGAQQRQANLRDYERAERSRKEFRTLVTQGGATASASGGGAAAFVTPAFLWQAYAVYRSPARVFCDQLNSGYTLPDWGMNCYIPTWSGGGTSVATDTENAALSETDPISGFQTGAIVQTAGKVTVSRAVTDRVGPGMSGDAAIFAQLKNQLGSQVNVYALNQALPSSQTVPNSGAFAVTTASGVGGMMGDIKTARNLTHDTLGTRVRATHLFTIGDLLDYVSSYADSTGRLLFEASHCDNPPAYTGANPAGDGWTGYMIGGLAAYADDSVPTTTTGNFAQIVVTRPSEIALLESEPVFSVYPQSLANDLEDIVVAREYTATIARYPSAIATIGGVAYTASRFV